MSYTVDSFLDSKRDNLWSFDFDSNTGQYSNYVEHASAWTVDDRNNTTPKLVQSFLNTIDKWDGKSAADIIGGHVLVQGSDYLEDNMISVALYFIQETINLKNKIDSIPVVDVNGLSTQLQIINTTLDHLQLEIDHIKGSSS